MSFLFHSGFIRTRILKVPMEFDFPADSKSLEIRHVVDLPAGMRSVRKFLS